MSVGSRIGGHLWVVNLGPLECRILNSGALLLGSCQESGKGIPEAFLGSYTKNMGHDIGNY